MTKRKGIGEDGKTLRQMLEEKRRLLKETGCYAGMTQPHLLRDDPIKAELFHSRILSSLIAGRETCKMVSGSPYVREVAELCMGLYTPEGDNVVQSTGIQVHIRLMGDNITWMIENNYEDDVIINDGDLFLANDPAIAGIHAADLYDMLPIFWEGELVAWVCTVIMEVDVGAVSPGCMPNTAVERGADGIKFCCEKIGFNDKLRRDFEIKIEMSLDLANIFLLDRKGAVAANIRVREEVKNMIREFGLDYFKKACRELIEEERRNQIARIRQRTVPGRFRDVVPFEIYMAECPTSWLPAKRDVFRLIPMQMDILPEGRLVLDFDGVGEWGWHPFNVTPKGLHGGLSIAVVQTLSYDGRGNLGSLLPCEIKLPAVDSLFNPSQIKKLATGNPWPAVIDVFSLWLGMLGAAFYMRGFREETFNKVSGSGWQLAGFDQYGVKRPMMVGGMGGFGCGASGVFDGIDTGAWIATMETDEGNWEVWELFAPHMSMCHMVDRYSVGYGRYRSGLSMGQMQLLHRLSVGIGSGATGCAHDRIVPNLGLFGGYPGGKRNTFMARYHNFQDTVDKRLPLIHEIGDPREFMKYPYADIIRVNHIPPTIEIRDKDLLISDNSSPGGLGDPIERDPALQKADLDNALTNADITARVYGIEARYDEKGKEWQIDKEGTRKLRAAKRQERLSRGVPVEQWWQKARGRVLRKEMDPLLLEMYRSSMKMSTNFAREYREFWGLPNDFAM
ncbi:MAG: hydantoinase B/oxoprolinase family protein [Chloroflexi bacterium]|nr:hydantoinase B/oxoprolinase family protein [Chloroflexota bacterium]